jgi:PAS domain S-box-containing protein
VAGIGAAAAHPRLAEHLRAHGLMAPNETQHRRMYLGFAAGFALLVALLGFAVSSVSKLAETLELNLETYNVVHAAYDARSSVELILAGYEGFALTMSDESLALMAEGEAGFDAALEEARVRTAGDPEQQERIERARGINAEWREEYREPSIGAMRESAATSSPVGLDPTLAQQQRLFRMYVDDLFGVIEEIRAHEEARLEARAEDVQWLKHAAFWLIGFGGLIGVIAAGAFATLGVLRSRALARLNQSLRQEVEERQRAEIALERASRRNSLILEAAGEGICGLDVMGRIIFLNPAAAEMLKVDEREVMLKPGATVLYRTALEGYAALSDEYPIYASNRDGDVHHAPLDTFRRGDGTAFPVEYMTRPIVEDGQVTGSVLTFQDISERRAVEKLKDEFVSVVSHELRTPLTSIRGSLGMLASGSLGTLEERGQRMLEIAAQNTDRLVRLINDILDMERIESGAVTMKPRLADADGLIEQAVESVGGMAEKSGVGLEVGSANATLWADPDRIIQVLTNLLSNAVKFSDPGSTVSLTACAEGGMLRFTVTDRGRGIPRAKLRSIFGRFQQVDASDSREKGGTGLGLAIARSIVLQHGGDIWVESEPGEGSSFHFTVPARGAAAGPSGGDRVAPCVLLCDDDQITLEVVGEQLRGHGYNVVTVASGEEAIEVARHHTPDAILLDLVMPGMDGCETMVTLKNQLETRDIPIIIFSSTPQSQQPQQLDGATAWVTKSAGEETLLRALERALRRGTRIGRILLVEDDEDLAEVLVTMFEAHGVEALHADSYADAIHLSRTSPPDLLVMDIVLREGDAFELVDCLRRDDQLRSVPLVVYSALDLDDAQRSRLRLGPTEFMTKGRVSPSEFEQRVVALLDELFTPEGAGV